MKVGLAVAPLVDRFGGVVSSRMVFCAGAMLWLGFISLAQAQERRTLSGHVPAAVQNAKPAGSLPENQTMRLALGIPLRDPNGLKAFLRDIYDPKSPNFRHYLTPDQFTKQFGPTQADYEAVAAFAQANGLTVVKRHSNRMLLDVTGPVAAVEKAFQVTLGSYQHPTENRTFFAPNREPSVPAGLAILDISGLNNYALPHPKLARNNSKPAKQATPRAGSGPTGTYMGGDFRAAYLPGVALTGAGQTVGLLQFDGYYPTDITNYEAQAGLPNVTLTNVLLDSYDGTPTGTDGTAEVSLDIEMTISMAPGVSKVMLYEAGPDGSQNDILNQMATDDAASQLSSSWGWSGGPSGTIDQIFQELDAQGQTFFNASGDSDAFTAGALDDPDNTDAPSDDPYITQVGGTTLTTTGPSGAWSAETVWNWGGGEGSSGGISSYYNIPSWQAPINMSSNGGSTVYRNTPDVALTADNVWVIYNNDESGDFGGTSCAAPLWAGFTALVNEQAANANKPVVGFLNPALYAVALTGQYSTIFRDVVTGNNTSSASPDEFYALPGYDLCTGLGTPTPALIDILAPPDALVITPPAGFSSTGGPGGPFTQTAQAYTLTNAGSSSLNWATGNTNAWLNVSPLSGSLNPGGPAATVSVAFNAGASNLPPGTYVAPISFTNLSDGVVQQLEFSLVVLGAPVIQSNPGNTTVRIGQDATFSVSAIGAPPLSYFWVSNNVPVPGANQASYTVSDPPLAESGAQFNCLVSNVYGMATSQVAVLTVSASIVLNGGFETGDFTDWTESGNIEFTTVTSQSGFAHSGTYGASLGPVGSLGYISQTLPTVAGSNYQVSLWLQNFSPGENDFQIIWNGSILYDGVDLPEFGWTNIQTVAFSSTTSSTLQIGFRNDPSYFALDDIAVQLSEPSAPVITSQPASQFVQTGGSATFAVGVSGSGPLFYQWYLTNAIPDATNSTLVLNGVGMAQLGAYFVVVTNALGSATSQSASLTFAPTNLLGNGGFETGDFTDWALNGDSYPYNYVSDEPGYVHSGNYSAMLGESGGYAFLSQSVPTTNAQLYLLSFWLINPYGGEGNGIDKLRVVWNNSVLYNHTDVVAPSFTNFQYLVTATGPGSTLQFAARNDYDYYGLDDVSLTPVPAPAFQSGAVSGNTFVLTWATIPGLLYQVQASTNLTLGSWANLGAPFPSNAYTYSLGTPIAGPQSFYRLILVSPAGSAVAVRKTLPHSLPAK